MQKIILNLVVLRFSTSCEVARQKMWRICDYSPVFQEGKLRNKKV